MRGKELLDKMGLIDPEYIVEAEAIPRRRRRTWPIAVAAAACICLGVFLLSDGGSAPLQPISIPEYEPGSMGFEGYMVFEADELENGNPWRVDMVLDTMPVYKNLAYDPSGAGIPKGLSEEKMRERLHETAEALGLEIISVEVIADGETNEATLIEAETVSGTLTVWANAHLRLDFGIDGGIELPEGLSITYSDTSSAEAIMVLEYLAEEYALPLGIENPVPVTWADRDIYGEKNQRYELYEATGNPVEDILSYNFRKIGFSPNEEGELWLVGANDALSVAEKIGDYPIVDVEEATQRLVEGHYSTSVPFAMPGDEYITRVELMYRSGPLEEFLIPYYRFYVLLPDTDGWIMERENGLKTYGAYYVPAITDEYITDMPVYDGHFN